MTDPDDDVYLPDPDAPKTDAEKSAQASKEVDAITKLALSLAAIATGLAFVLGWAEFAKGLLLGGVVATVNLRVLAKAGWRMLSGSDDARGILLGFLGSFALLILGSMFVAFVKPDWTLGFGAGLALPAIVGVAWAMTKR